jgi:hypothetical protein
LGKEHSATVLQVVASSLKPEILIKGFKACGPWSPDAIDFTKCIGKQITNKEKIINNVEHCNNDKSKSNNITLLL